MRSVDKYKFAVGESVILWILNRARWIFIRELATIMLTDDTSGVQSKFNHGIPMIRERTVTSSTTSPVHACTTLLASHSYNSSIITFPHFVRIAKVTSTGSLKVLEGCKEEWEGKVYRGPLTRSSRGLKKIGGRRGTAQDTW